MNTLVDTPTDIQPGKITLRTQAHCDIVRVQQLCPQDQSRVYRGAWDGPNFVLTEEKPAPAAAKDDKAELLREQIAQVAAWPPEDVETRAAELGVKFAKNASPQTKVELVAKAILADSAK